MQSAFQVTNNGTTSVALSDISIKMWVYDTTATQRIVTDVNAGGCATVGSSCVHQVTGVKATVASASPACGPDANHQASWEITISSTDTTALAAGGRWTNMQTGIHLGNWANFTPGTSRWFSPCLTSGGAYVADPHYAVYYKGDLVFASGVNTPPCRGPIGTQPLSGYRTPQIASAPLVGPVPPETPMYLTVGLPVRNQAALKQFIRDAASPTQPQTYRQYLTPEQYASNYGPLRTDYQKVIDWAQAAGFTVTKTFPDHMLVSIRGTAAKIEKALFLNLNYYSRPDGTQFYAPDREPSVNLAPTLRRVSNLENFYVPKPNLDTETGQLLGPTDFHDNYAGCHPELQGDGQTVALFSYAAYDIDELKAYGAAAGIPESDFANVSMVSVQGASTTPDTGRRLEEANMDVEMVLSMAPKASVVMYVSPPDLAGTNEALALIANSQALQVSSSWGMFSDAETQDLLDELASQRQSFFHASGDSGGIPVDSGGIWDMENVTLVGGTTPLIYFLVGSTPLNLNRDTAWSGSGGGVLTNVPLPYYQVGVPGLASATHRNFPDVAAYASTVERYANGKMVTECCAGTSASSPIWAGFIALANSLSAEHGLPAAGFINPAIYFIGQSSDYETRFTDITLGATPNTDPAGTAGVPTYFASEGYDLTTGWGSPKCALIDKLATPCAPSDTDPHNCGACWHDCLGGACVGGVCQPVRFQGLGVDPGGHYTLASIASAVSPDGTTVAGTVYGNSYALWSAFRWTAAAGMVLRFGLSEGETDAAAISAVNIVGSETGTVRQALVWNGGKAIRLTGFGTDDTYATGVAANWSAYGSVVVGYSDGSSGKRALRWANLAVAPQALDAGATYAWSIANGVSADGSIVVGNTSQGAFQWTAAGGLTILPGGAAGTGANAISADGTVVAGTNGSGAVRWVNGQAATALGGTEAARAVNGDGSVVVGGYAEAFIWDAANGYRALATVLTAAGADLTGWTLTGATGVSSDGKVIVGVGSHNDSDEGWIARLP